MRCSTCNLAFTVRRELTAHYHSDLHILNSKLREKGKSPLSQSDLELLRDRLPVQEESERERKKRERKQKAREEMEKLVKEEEERLLKGEAEEEEGGKENNDDDFGIPAFETFPDFQGMCVNLFDHREVYDTREECLESMEKLLGFSFLFLCFFFHTFSFVRWLQASSFLSKTT